jgi:hypothetical protein
VTFVSLYPAYACLTYASVVFVMTTDIDTDTSVIVIVWPPVLYMRHRRTLPRCSALTVYLDTDAGWLV